MILRSSVVQTYITKKVAAYLSKELNTEISVGGVDIAYFLDIVLEDVLVKDLKQDTLIYSNKIIADIDDINIDKHILSIDKVKAESAYFNVKEYETDTVMSIQFLIDYFSSGNVDTLPSAPWQIKVSNVELQKSRFSLTFEKDQQQQASGINFSHMRLREIDAKIRNITIIGDTITADIDKLNAKEISGLILKSFTAKARVSGHEMNVQDAKLVTNQSNINLDLNFSYNRYLDYLDFVNKVKITSAIYPSQVNMADIAYFATPLYGINENIKIRGEVRGPVADLKGKNIILDIGTKTHFNGNFGLTGLPEIEETYIYLNVKELTTSKKEIENIPIPPFDKKTRLSLPPNIGYLGDVTVKGKFSGFYNDFVANANISTAIGKVVTDVKFKIDPKTKETSYKGHISSNAFNLGKMMDMTQYLGKITFGAEIDGKGLTLDKLNASISGNIDYIDFYGYGYKNIKVGGDVEKRKFAGMLTIYDENINMNFAGRIDFSSALPEFDFSSQLSNVNLVKLNLIKQDSIKSSWINASLKFNFVGLDIDKMKGTVQIKDVCYAQNGKEYTMDYFNLTTNEKASSRFIKIESDLLDASIDGYFSFLNLSHSVLSVMRSYMPRFIPDTIYNKSLYENFFFKIRIKNINPITQLFVPSIEIANNSVFSGVFNSDDKALILSGKAPMLKINGIKINYLYVDVKTENNLFVAKMGCDEFLVNDKTSLENVVIETKSRDDSVQFKLDWYNEGSLKNSGDIIGKINFSNVPKIEISLKPSKIYLNDSLWLLSSNDIVSIDSSSIDIKDLKFRHQTQEIRVNGIISERIRDSIFVAFGNFNLANLNFFTSNQGYDLQGKMSGQISLNNIYNNFNLGSFIEITNLAINQEQLGNAAIKTNWDPINKAIGLDASILRGSLRTFDVKGFYYPYRPKDYLDFTIELEKLKLSLIQNYLKGMVSDLRGIATGKVLLKGSFEKPDVTGKLMLQKVGFRIDYLNTFYTLANEITFNESSIDFDDLTVNDSLGNTAILNGRILHDYFKNFRMYLYINAKNFAVLNTNASQNNLYYGNAFMTGLIEIKGTPENITLDIKAKTEKNTRFFLPLNSTQEVSENAFINFVSNNVQAKTIEESKVDLSGIQLNFDLEVTPDAEAQIIFDSKIGDIIRARGSGNMKFEINTLGDFKMYGNYDIDDGDYLFTMQNVINKRFRVQKGSSIRWNGSPYDADADLVAIYKVKTTTKAIEPGNVDTTQSASARVPVDCIIRMTDKLMNPTIVFDIDFPSMDEYNKEQYKAVVKPDLNMQVLSLLIINSFITPSGRTPNSNSAGTGSAVGANSSELLSNQLSNWLSQISKDFDIGVKYRPGDQMSSNELEVALATQLFNDRVSVDGNFGVAGKSTQNTSNIVGDVNIEAKVTKDGKVKVKAYNKTNTTDMVIRNSPYTQGVGIFYRKEFDYFKDLFIRRKKKTLVK